MPNAGLRLGWQSRIRKNRNSTIIELTDTGSFFIKRERNPSYPTAGSKLSDRLKHYLNPI